ncbi:hypothetical protein GBA52_008350 [Prunus armeniaca]|nr:hypothetical protein GBA52_008350 [Prunus armeniaca]
MNDDDIDYDAEWPALEEMIGDDDHLTDTGEDLYMVIYGTREGRVQLQQDLKKELIVILKGSGLTQLL